MNEEMSLLFLSSGLPVAHSNVVLLLYTQLIVPSKLNVVQFKKLLFAVTICRVIFLQDLQFGQPIQ